jgi:tRNA(fMet)-specific endonuclease VapC
LEIAGNVIEDLDLQIASIALRHNASLVTHNQRHFQRVPNLTLEDWLS